MSSKQKVKDKISKFWNYLEDNNIEKAEEISDEICSNYPENATPYYIKGHLLLAKNQFKESVQNFEIALERSEEDRFSSFVSYWIGEVYSTKRFLPEDENEIYDLDKANRYYLKSVSFDEFPSNAINKLNRYFNKHPEEALKIISDSIKKIPKEIDYYIRLSDVYKYHFNDEDNYIKVLENAYENCDKTSELLILIANYYQSKNEFETAIKYYEEAKNLTDDTDNIDLINYEKGNVFLKDSAYKKGIIQYCKCLESNTISIKFLSKLSLSFCYLKDNDSYSAAELIENIDISELRYIALAEDQFFLNGNIDVSILPAFSFQEFLQLLHSIEKIDKTRLKSKISYIKSLLYGEGEEYLSQINELLNACPLLNYDFLHEQIAEGISNYFTCEQLNSEIGIEVARKVKDIKKVKSFLLDYYLDSITDDLLEKKKYSLICELVELLNPVKLSSDVLFNLSYSYNEIGNYERAKSGYTNYLREYGELTAVLNNLGNIFHNEGDKIKAIELYSKAVELDPDDEIAKNNLKRVEKQKVHAEEKQKEVTKRINEYRTSLINLKTENDYVLQKLSNFINNLKSEGEVEDNQIAIPIYKFAVLMQTSKEKANSLKDRFIEKGYIYKTTKRNQYRAVIYEINPLLEEEIRGTLEEMNQVVEPSWIKGFEDITKEKLKQIKYFESLKKIRKINKKFSKYISRDYKELVFNYLVGNKKATIVLSGSMVEFLIIYYCEKKRVRSISYTNPRSMNTTTRNLYDSSLFELITYADQNNFFGRDFTHLGNLLRVYRNLIHPGLELKDDLGEIDRSKLEISFIGAMEILNKVIK